MNRKKEGNSQFVKFHPVFIFSFFSSWVLMAKWVCTTTCKCSRRICTTWPSCQKVPENLQIRWTCRLFPYTTTCKLLRHPKPNTSHSFLCSIKHLPCPSWISLGQDSETSGAVWLIKMKFRNNESQQNMSALHDVFLLVLPVTCPRAYLGYSGVQYIVAVVQLAGDLNRNCKLPGDIWLSLWNVTFIFKIWQLAQKLVLWIPMGEWCVGWFLSLMLTQSWSCHSLMMNKFATSKNQTSNTKWTKKKKKRKKSLQNSFRRFDWLFFFKISSELPVFASLLLFNLARCWDNCACLVSCNSLI